MTVLHIGFDDTDSRDGMCTTYIGAIVVDKLKKMNVKILDYPRLVRLNPNWPYKTRGNCAIAIKARLRKSQVPIVKSFVLRTVQKLAELHHDGTNPGVVFFENNHIPKKLRLFCKRVIQSIVTLEEAENLASEIGAEIFKFKLGNGVIGALAAIGVSFKDDRTYELVTYRTPSHWGTERRLDAASVFEMNSATYPETFDNIDPTTSEIRIAPHTPCPVMCGIRAENPIAAKKAHTLIKILEPIDRSVIYKTNQATDSHIKRAKICEVEPYSSFEIQGSVILKPNIMIGGHVIFRIRDDTGEIDCAAYEPTKKFRDIITKLVVGDLVRVYGGVKPKPSIPLTVNLEKIDILEIAPIYKKINPLCSRCGRRTKSAGKNKGFICKKCKTRLPMEKIEIKEISRDIVTGRYEVPPRARRHLAKPLVRFERRELIK